MTVLPSCTAAGNDYRQVEDWPAVATPTVTVIIPIYNRADLLDRTLGGLHRQTMDGDRFDVVVADDGSEEDVGAVVATHESALRIRYVRQEHIGFGLARARNLGAAEASGEVLVFLDADCIPAPDFLERHAAWHSRAANLVVAGTRVDIDSSDLTTEAISQGTAQFGEQPEPKGAADQVPSDWRRVFYRRTRNLVLADTGFRAAIGANLSLRRERFSAVGGYSDSFSGWGGEDTEFNWRIWNDGAFFVPDNRAIAYHQIQHDPENAAEQREAARRRSSALVADRIPHSFYRRVATPFASVPKVTWWVRVETAPEAEIAWRECSYATYPDAEILFSGSDEAIDHLQALGAVSNRVRVISGEAGDVVTKALHLSRGELVAMLDGRVRINRGVLAKAVGHLDDHPLSSTVRAGYRFSNGDRYLNPTDLLGIDEEVGRGGLPLFAVVRRRELMKDWAALADPVGLWQTVARRDRNPQLLVKEAVTIQADPPAPRPGSTVRDLAATGPAELARTAVRRIRRHSEDEASSLEPDSRIPIAYVGLTGKNNLGDDAVLEAVTQLMPWAHFDTNHANPQMLLIGGGTLLNGRGYYLNKMLRQDSPTVERAMFGTGVRQPEFWGVTEPMEEWFAFMESAVLTGVRGPDSIENLRTLGYQGDVEILGDPALSLLPPPDSARVEGRVVICPLNTGGNLHGKDDAVVLDTLTRTAQRLRNQGREVVMLSAYPEDDRWIIGMMAELGTPLPYLAGYADFEGSMRLLASADLVIGERLHAAIMAAACLTPFVALQYRPKVLDFTKSIGQEAATVRTDEMARMDEVVDHLLANRDETSAAIEGPVRHFRERHQKAAADLQSLLRS